MVYKKSDGVAMESPLGPSLVNAFFSYHEKHEKNLLNSSPQKFKAVFYQHYVNDISVIFQLNNHLKYF